MSITRGPRAPIKGCCTLQVLRCSREQIARIEADDPVVAIVLHRWFAETLAGRLSETMHTLDSLLD